MRGENWEGMQQNQKWENRDGSVTVDPSTSLVTNDDDHHEEHQFEENVKLLKKIRKPPELLSG